MSPAHVSPSAPGSHESDVDGGACREGDMNMNITSTRHHVLTAPIKTTRTVTSVFWDIEEPRPAEIWGRCLDCAAYGKRPPLLELLPWARSAIDRAIEQWVAIGNDPGLVHVDVQALNFDCKTPPDVHAHFGEKHASNRIPVTICMDHCDYGGFEVSTTIVRKAARA
jgi:hypothetical protein